jgi:hypothetical protein
MTGRSNRKAADGRGGVRADGGRHGALTVDEVIPQLLMDLVLNVRMVAYAEH